MTLQELVDSISEGIVEVYSFADLFGKLDIKDGKIISKHFELEKYENITSCPVLKIALKVELDSYDPKPYLEVNIKY